MNELDLNIPTLDIEDFDPEVAEQSAGIEDQSGGALTYGLIGSGQGGGRIAKAFYKKTVAFNTAESDLALLELPENHKFHVDFQGGQGAGKDQTKAAAAYESRRQEVFNRLREVFGNKVDRILVCVGVAGGTGGGSVNTLVDIAKDYFTYVGQERLVPRR